jgi:hypothetical protein
MRASEDEKPMYAATASQIPGLPDNLVNRDGSAVPVLPPIRFSVLLGGPGVPVSAYRPSTLPFRGAAPGVGDRATSPAAAGDRYRLEIEQLDSRLPRGAFATGFGGAWQTPFHFERCSVIYQLITWCHEKLAREFRAHGRTPRGNRYRVRDDLTISA